MEAGQHSQVAHGKQAQEDDSLTSRQLQLEHDWERYSHQHDVDCHVKRKRRPMIVAC